MIGEVAEVIVQHRDEDAGRRIKYASAHDLRRGCAQRLINVGVSAETLKVVMRHKDFRTTEKFYGATREAQSAAAEINAKLASECKKGELVGGHEEASQLSAEELRPNEFSPEDWERLSRDEQIQWWKDNAPPERPPSHPLRAVTLYDEGGITRSEIPFFVFERLTDENVQEFIAGCSPAVREILQAQADQLPADDDDDGWENVRIARWSTAAPWVPVEEIRQAEAESNRRYREGVKLFREHAGPHK